MGKRRHKKSNEDIRRKIRRLERKLHDDRDDQRCYGERRRRSETPSSYSSRDRDRHEVSDDDYESERGSYEPEFTSDREDNLEDDHRTTLSSTVRRVDSSNLAIASTSKQTVLTVPNLDPCTVSATQINEVPSQEVTEVCDVPQKILDLLGEAKQVEQVLGEKVPSEISERWGKILVDGLAKEQKDSLIGKMLIPENFLLARALKLNPEVAAVLTDNIKNRDKRLEKGQNQLGSGLAGLVTLSRDLIKGDMDKLEIVKRISGVSQLLLDLHYEETINRRKLIVPLLDKKFWNTIQGVKRENYLFGDKLGENIKNTKDIEKSSQQIKKPPLNQQPYQRRSAPLAGNARAPPCQQSRVKSAAAPASRYQPPAPTRRTAMQQRTRPASSNKYQDRRHR